MLLSPARKYMSRKDEVVHEHIRSKVEQVMCQGDRFCER
jgi:hypothetical protein